MEPEYFQYLLLMLISVGKARPHNLQLISSLMDEQLVREMLSQQDIGPSYQTTQVRVRFRTFFPLFGSSEAQLPLLMEVWVKRQPREM